jgi:hypothetical protein
LLICTLCIKFHDVVILQNTHEFIESIEVESLDNQQEKNLKSSIPEWIIENRVPVSHASSLLKILHHEAGLKFLPLDARTLLGSLRTKVQTTDIRPGRYYNFGIISIIAKSLLPSNFPEIFELIWNIDGIPLTKSGLSTCWPIIGRIQSCAH